MIMRFAVLVMLMLGMTGLVSCAQENGQAPEKSLERGKVSESVENFGLRNLRGETVELRKYIDARTPVLIKFWATWCPYCRKQVANMNWLRQNFSESELGILAIDSGEPLEKVKAYSDAAGIEYEVLLDLDGAVADRFGFDGIPTFILLDHNGVMVDKSNGVSQDLVNKIEEVVGKRKSDS